MTYPKAVLLLAALSMGLLAGGCARSGGQQAESVQSPAPTASTAGAGPSTPASPASSAAVPNVSEQPSEAPGKPEDPVQAQLDNMTLNEKIGQMVIVGLDGTELQADARKMIETYKVGGFILYKPNITNANQTLTFLNQLKKANKPNPAALWLSTDQEGGRVSRMPEPYLKIPTAKDIGQKNSTAYATGIGQALGEEIKSVGFNLDFAPVMDINSNPNNPVIGDRSYGADADAVIKNGTAVLKGLQSEGIAAVIKHFPGHGDTSVDSHLELPVVNKSLKQLEAFELLPFQAAVKQGTDMVMVAHLLIPKIDPDYPASLSKQMITGLLRDKLGFDGVVITDDLTMGGIVKHYGIAEAAVRSIQAGSDIVLVGHDTDRETAVIEALRKAAGSGKLAEQEIDQHVYRILKLKQKYKLSDNAVSTVDVSAVNADVKKLLNP
ncbi:beta-N-acetylhexosaminidase [Paenibacillus yonginensis]|uniref:beta-N-acetylhexosaminidase n=1 Tax=Paenibacillus yonginensis TaxID=1462996 RepID=UPI000838E0B5|nr:beta-N-acetylhexosaminidase [Paenibacillus yonginensis]